MKAGFAAFPSAVIQYQDQLNLSSVELNVLLQIVDHWWDPERHPFPSKGLIARRMKIWPRSAQRVIARLEKRGLIERVERKHIHGGHKSNEYRLAGLIQKAEPFAKEIVDKYEKRTREKAQRSRRKSPGLHLVPSSKS